MPAVQRPRGRAPILPAVAAAAVALLASGAVGAEQPVDDPALFEYRDRPYGPADLGPKLGKALHELELRYHRERAILVDEALFQIHLSEEAARTGEPRRAVAERLLSVPEPTEEEVARFYAENRTRIDGTLQEVASRIARHLRQEALAARKEALIEQVKREGGFVATLEPPGPPPIAFDLEGFPIRGRASAPVTVVEFGDYQCPRCRRAASIMRGLIERHPDLVRLVYLDFPINRSGVSRRVAEGAACAARQDAYWVYHDLAFDRQPELDADSPRALASDLGLDMEAFDACLAGSGPRDWVRRAERQARALGVQGTPAVYVNGRPLATHDLAGDLEAWIQALAAPET